MKIRYILITVIASQFALTSISFSQEALGLREKADRLYFEYNYAQAALLYQKLADSKKPKLRDLERLADCYQKVNDYEGAENWYIRITADETAGAENFYNYGAVLKNNGKYKEAKQALQRYINKTGTNAKLEAELAGCDSAIVWMAKPTGHLIRNEQSINTPQADFAGFVQGNNLYYVGEPEQASGKNIYKRTGNGFLQIYTAQIGEHNLLSNSQKAQGLPFESGEYHIGPLKGNKTGTVLFVTRTYAGKNTENEVVKKRKYKTNNLELYIYTKDGDSWKSQAFPYNNTKEYSLGHASLSPDEKTLYFVSDMPGGLGGTDIWFSELQNDGTWGQPKNAGAVINTAGDEMFPNIHDDGNLYYSTDGLAGLGGLDIFVSKGEKNNWVKPKNLAYPLNSAGDDFAFIINENKGDQSRGFFSSNRKDGVGNDDIYSFSYAPPRIILALQGISYNKKSGEILPQTAVTLKTAKGDITGRQTGEKEGIFFFELAEGTDYSVLGQKAGFYADSATISTKGITKSDTLKVALRLEPLFEKGKTLRIENIHYNFDKDDIRPDAARILNELVRTLRDNPTLRIELASHTDSRGSDAYNMDLSQRRAQSVVNYLVSRGIARDRLVAKGYGESRLLNRCANGVACSIAEHQANRRTEFTIIDF